MRFFQDRFEWLNKIRSVEFDVIFNKNINKRFHKVLDLGAGEGSSSYRLSSISDGVVAADYDLSRLSRIESDKVDKIVCDAEYLSFKEKQFDLIFSSNLLEHVPDPNLVLRNIYRILSDDGILIITVPNRIWKILSLIFFYPNQFCVLAKKLFDPSKNINDLNLNSNISTQNRYGFIRRNIWPVPHGINRSNRVEFIAFGRKQWLGIMNNSDFEISKEIENMPLYSGYPLVLIDSFFTFFSKFGFSSSFVFILKKKDLM